MKKVNVKIFCKASAIRKNGTAPIYYVIIIDSKKKLIFTGKYVPPQFFDNGKEKVKPGYGNSIQLNSYLQNEVKKIEAIILDFEKRNIAISHERITDAYLNKENPEFLPYAKSELRKERKSEKTMEQHTGSLKNLEKYAPNVTFDQLTPAFMREYEAHFIKLGRKKNGYMHDFVTIRKYVLLAIEAGLMKSSPFGSRNGKFKIEYEETTPERLYEEEVDKLFKIFDSGELSPKLYHSLLYFLLAVETGLRYGDTRQIASRMFRGSILQDDTMEEGEPYVRGNSLYIILGKTSNKDKTYHRIPLSQRAIKLIETKVEKEILGNKYINEDIRTIGKMVGITRHFVFHSSRHTFGTQGNTDGIDQATLQKLLGHRTADMTKKYAKIIDPVLDREMLKKDKLTKNPENEALIEAFKKAIETNPEFKDQLSKILMSENREK